MRIALAASLVLACGARSEIPNPIVAEDASTPPPPAVHGVFGAWCNGPSEVGFYFSTGDPDLTCDDTGIQPNQRIVNFAMLRHIEAVPTGTITMPVQWVSDSTAYGDVCVSSKDNCKPLTGTVTIVDFDPSAPFVDVWFDVHAQNEAPFAGTFRANHCPLLSGGCF